MDFAINWHSCFFLLFAAAACGFAVAVVLSSNIVRMACCLVVSLSAVAGLFFLAGAEFLGAAQLMIYVGGTMVLLIFGVMLTARGPFIMMKTGGGQWVLALVIGIALFVVLLQAATSSSAWKGAKSDEVAAVDMGKRPATALAGEEESSHGATPPDAADGRLSDEITNIDETSNISEETPEDTAGQLGLGLLGVRTEKTEPVNPEKKIDIQREGMSGYLLAFEIISMHLVVVLVGAAFLARARRRIRGPEPRSPESRVPNPESL